MASKAEILEQLRELGTVEARTALAKHGAPKPIYGVRFADLDALAKRHRGEHALALALWASKNVDARLLATKIADPGRMSAAELDAWLADLRWYMGVDVFVAELVVRSAHARAKADAWRKSKAELTGRAGWAIIAHLARDPKLPDEWFAGCLDEILAGLGKAPNRKREAMNSALIAIGGYREGLRERALEVADRIGVVEIDHGETYCKTPQARPYIEAMAARASKKRSGKRATANKKATAKKPTSKKKPTAKKEPTAKKSTAKKKTAKKKTAKKKTAKKATAKKIR